MAGMAEFNYRDFQRQGTYNEEADKTLLVKFFLKPRMDQTESKKEGRPIYRDVEHIDIKIPGNRNAGAARPATPADKERFHEHYKRFKDRIENEDNTGTPLSEWPPISRSQAEELSFFHVKTVEQLSTMSDSQTSKFMGLMALREQARIWLEKANEDKKLFELSDQIKIAKKNNQTLQEELAELRTQLNALQNNTKPPPKKRGRKKKIIEPEPETPETPE